MGALEIIVIVLAVAIVISVIITSFIRRKKGKTCCSDCSKCSCCSCGETPKEKDNPQTNLENNEDTNE